MSQGGTGLSHNFHLNSPFLSVNEGEIKPNIIIRCVNVTASCLTHQEEQFNHFNLMTRAQTYGSFVRMMALQERSGIHQNHEESTSKTNSAAEAPNKTGSFHAHH